MKRITYTLLSLLCIVAISSCERGDSINVITQDIDLNENSQEYQTYLKERIESHLQTYRFEEAKRLMAKLTGEEAQKKFGMLYEQYHQQALTQGCGYILETGDTVFLKVMNKDEIPPKELTYLKDFYDYPELKGNNKEATLWGLGNYPALESLVIPSCFVSKVKDLDKLKNLRVLTLTADKAKYEWWFTSKTFKPIDMSGYDLSQNHKIDSLLFDGVDISNLRAPANHIMLLSLKNGVYNNANLNNIHAKNIEITASDAADEQLTISNKSLSTLSIESEAGNKMFKVLDVKNSSVHHLLVSDVSYSKRSLNKIILNDKIDTLVIGGYSADNDDTRVAVEGLSKLINLRYLSYNPNASPIATKELPANIEYLAIGGSGKTPYKDNDSFDYTHLQKLKVYSNGKFYSSNLKLPASIDSIYLFPSTVFGNLTELDFSSTRLTKADFYIGSPQRDGKDIPLLKRMVFPATQIQLKISSPHTEVLDLSRCSHLKNLSIDNSSSESESLKKIILPKNLKKSNFKRLEKTAFSGDYAFYLFDINKDVVIENLPSWVKHDDNGKYFIPDDN
ncbi:MAG: hypothetical protein ACTTIW_02790 [Porphyromonas sp.]